MRLFIFVALFILIVRNIAFAGEGGVEDKRVFTIYVYNNLFHESFEKGRPMRVMFEKKCNCIVNMVLIGKGGGAISRLQIGGKNNKADVVLGMDTQMLPYMEDSGLLAPHNVDVSNLKVPIKWKSKLLMPVSYGYLAFIYDKTKLQNPPKSLKELVYGDGKYKILLQDPRKSYVGLSLLIWMAEIFKNDFGDAWYQIFPGVVAISKNISESFALFMKHEADLVFSYTSFLLDPVTITRNPNYEYAEFEEGHYLQVKAAGKLKNSPNPDLADMFLEFIISKDFQAFIPSTTYMYPVLDLGNDMPEAFGKIKIPDKIIYADMARVKKEEREWIKEWLNILSKTSY